MKLKLIQSCRGLAALLVVLFHAAELSRSKFQQDSWFAAFQFGHSGVNFFFVLSGFIIFYIHQSDIGRKSKLKQFILKRFIRIYPLYWLVALTLLFVLYLNPDFGSAHPRNIAVIVKSLLLLPQWQNPIISVGWTLSHEVFFYAVFSLLIYLKPKLSKTLLIGWLAVTLLLFLLEIANVFKLDQDPAIRLIFSYHNLEFFLGCLSAYIVTTYKTLNHKSWNFTQHLSLLGLSLFTISATVFNHQPPQVADVLTYGIPSAMIILGAASIDLEQVDAKQKVEPAPLFCYLGDASYSIYLTHYAFLSALVKFTLAINSANLFNVSAVMILLILISVSLGCFVHSYVEKPLIQALKKKFIA
jgi:peptidoglycan/LPS O-acetylase OafA/YrhL